MRIIGTIIGVLLVFLGGLWILQGSNIVGGSVMSGQSQWLTIVALLAGVTAIWWFQFRRR
jgi:hypothetical protein